ncbi:hypothetical protein NFI96_015738 [Prochilodus magdalenae]|nr:hypothetical protein NFI96_015738 [Prochilodus magdalenae]
MMSFIYTGLLRLSSCLHGTMLKTYLNLVLFVLGSGSSEVVRFVGDSVQMDILGPVQEFEEFIWEFNRNTTVLKYYNEFKKTKCYPGYEGRVEFNNRTYSLTLKNLQKNDSGSYEARVSGARVAGLAEYSLSVSDRINQPDESSEFLGLVAIPVVVIVVILIIVIYYRWRGSAGAAQNGNAAAVQDTEIRRLGWLGNRFEVWGMIRLYNRGFLGKLPGSGIMQMLVQTDIGYCNDLVLTQYGARRVEFNYRNYSLTLKNLQKTDSGLYEVKASAAQVTVVAEYSLSVLEAKHQQNPGSSWLVWVTLVVIAVIAAICILLIYRRRRRSAGVAQCQGSVYAEIENSSTQKEVWECRCVGKEDKERSCSNTTCGAGDIVCCVLCYRGEATTYKCKKVQSEHSGSGEQGSEQGSSDVFRSVGDSVQLDIQLPVPEFDDFIWVFNKTNNILKYYKETNKTRPYPGYEGRVEFNYRNYSLTLKNLQKTDSGLYEAKGSAARVTVVAEYRLSVLDPVEAPVLTPQSSNYTCNITLTCRGHDLSISSRCYNKICEEKEVTSPRGITLSLSINGSSIICNHSNPVSWKEAVLETVELERLCADEGGTSPLNWLLLGGGAVVIIIIIITLIAVFIRLCLRRRKSTELQSQNVVVSQSLNWCYR